MSLAVLPDGLMSAWLRFGEILLFVQNNKRTVGLNKETFVSGKLFWFRLLFLFVISLVQDIAVFICAVRLSYLSTPLRDM